MSYIENPIFKILHKNVAAEEIETQDGSFAVYIFREGNPRLDRLYDYNMALNLIKDISGGRNFESLPPHTSVVIYNIKDEKVYAIRDRVGVVPLYWCLSRDMLILDTSSRHIVEQGYVSKQIDPQSVDSFLTLQYVPGNRTMWRDVKKIPPGCYLEFDGKSPITFHRYWDLKFVEFDGELSKPTLMNILSKSYNELPIIDDKVICFISGGIDSATNATYLQNRVQHIYGLTVLFNEASYNEGESASQVCKHLKLQHFQAVYRREHLHLQDVLHRNSDAPLGDQAALAAYVALLSCPKQNVIVSGEGGDEVFGLPRKSPINLAQKGTLDSVSLAKLYLGNVQHVNSDTKGIIYSDKFKLEVNGDELVDLFTKHLNDSGTDDLISKLMYLQYKTWLSDCVISKDIQVARAVGASCLFPLTDFRLIDYMSKFQNVRTFNEMNNKQFIRSFLNENLPKEVLSKEKHTFSVPMREWFDDEYTLRQLYSRIGHDNVIWELLDKTSVEMMISEHSTGKRNLSLPLWLILTLASWLSFAPVEINL